MKDTRNFECLSSIGCVSLEHTNVRMSGNVKLVWKSDSELFMESISSDDYISSKTFKNIAVDVNQGYRHNVQQFLAKVSKRSSIWNVKKVEARKSESFSDQYQDLYKWGAYTETNDLIDKRFRFFAPLFTYGKLPDRFLIFRAPNASYTRFRNYLENSTLLLSVDMSENSTYGRYLRTLTQDSNFKNYCIFANFKESFIRYHGIDINSGKFKFNTESDLDSYLANERTVQEFNNALTNGWMRGELICPNILNLEFAFDDNISSEGFNNYIGLYVYDNEITQQEADVLQEQDGVIVLNYDESQVKKYEPDNTGLLMPLPDYTQIISTTTTTQLVKTEMPPIAEIYLPFKPVPGTIFGIEYKGKRYVEIYMMEEYIRTDSTDEVLRMIANEINSLVTDDIIISASVVDSTLIIRSNITSDDYENITIILPSVFTINQPTWYIDIPEDMTTEQAYHSMRMISYQDVIINASQVPKETTIIEVDGKDYQLEQKFTYRTANVIRLDESFSDVRQIISSVIKFKKIVQSKFSLLSYVEHVDFDMSMLESPYYDIYDFDMQGYQVALGKQMHESFERYDAGNPTQLDTELINAYISYFGFNADTDPHSLYEMINGTAVPIAQETLADIPSKEVLIKVFDELTMFPSETCKNEFERLGEQALEETRNLNRLEPMICKFVSSRGLDCYMNPISLNIGLPWRNDNFIVTSYESRSVVNNTHMWFMMGSGPGPIQDGTFSSYLNDIHKQLSYANLPISESQEHNSITVNILGEEYDPLNTKFDVYELLKYKYNSDASKKSYDVAESWTSMYKVEGEENVYNAVFRGGEWQFIGNYEGYKFSVILVTSVKLTRETGFTAPFILVENKVFKTLTLIINHYIADRLITSLNGTVPYYLDRSYLYYASKNYVPDNTDDIQDINSTEAISLNIFRTHQRISKDDLSELHSYKENPVVIEFFDERTQSTKYIDNWFTLDEDSKPIFYVSINPVNRTLSLKDIVHTDENGKQYIEWLHINELSDNQISVLVRYTAYDIVEIDDVHLWCHDIFVEFIVNDVYLEDWDSLGNIHHHTMSLEDIVTNGKDTIEIDGCTYTIPFAEKILSSEFGELPITDSQGNIRKGLMLTKEFYEEIDDRYTYDKDYSSFIRTSVSGKSFLTFSDSLNLDVREGMLLEKDQYWFMLKSFSKENSVYFNFNTSNQSYKTITADYVKNILDMYPIKTYIADVDGSIIETSKKIEFVSPDETYIIISLKYNEDENVLERLDSYTSFKIIRHTGYYSPLFKKILQPESCVIENYIHIFQTYDEFLEFPYHKRHIGQMSFVVEGYQLYSYELGITNDNIHKIEALENTVIILETRDDISKQDIRSEEQIYYVKDENEIYKFQGGIYDSNFLPQEKLEYEYLDCVCPENLIETYEGRKICTNTDEPDNYCEEFKDSHIKNVYDQYFYTAQYEGTTYSVIPDAALTEHRGFISNTYLKEKEFEISTNFSETLDLIFITRDKLGPTILSKYLYSADPSMFDMLNALKLYNSELDESNIVYENYYQKFYERFFIEFFQKHYKLSLVTASNNMYHKIDFYYQDYSTVVLKQTSVNDTPITSIILTFTKI